MSKVRVLPNFITAFNLACGLFVIFKVATVSSSEPAYNMIFYAALLLLLAAFADLLDGLIARAIHGESDFGFMFDSLADAISFGAAPSVILLKSFQLDPESWMSIGLIASAMVYSICAILRLVRFNVSSQQAKGDVYAELLSKKMFTGLPVPGAAAMVVSANLFLASPMMAPWESSRIIIMPILFIIIGYFMVSRWKFPTLKTAKWQIPSFPLIFCTALIAVFILWGVVHNLSLVLASFSFFYLIVGLIFSIMRKCQGEDDEPN
ncbi:MAG: CDP-alcohol phosphatidyltransferase family protein [Simkaniaceae bacterium]|nr:CDP-alcohol phosphatidyltransferase family protein [Simkaniaceae bacterium]